MKNDITTVESLFDELKEELTFLPDHDAIKEGFLFGFKWTLTQ
jgi:hypothetical protein